MRHNQGPSVHDHGSLNFWSRSNSLNRISTNCYPEVPFLLSRQNAPWSICEKEWVGRKGKEEEIAFLIFPAEFYHFRRERATERNEWETVSTSFTQTLLVDHGRVLPLVLLPDTQELKDGDRRHMLPPAADKLQPQCLLSDLGFFYPLKLQVRCCLCSLYGGELVPRI